MAMRTIEQIAPDVRVIVANAVKDLGADLQGYSVIDLVCDNIPDRISTADIKVALVTAQCKCSPDWTEHTSIPYDARVGGLRLQVDTARVPKIERIIRSNQS